MFNTLTDRLEAAFSRLSGRGKLSESDVEEVLKEVRVALLEADVHTKVVRSFVDKIRERAIGDEVSKALTPGQQVVKIVHEELVAILGAENVPLAVAKKAPTVIMMAGLQGSGKTTAAGKLAKMLRAKGKRPILVACDLRRPAAIEQLQLLGKQVDIPVYSRTDVSPVEVAAAGVEEAIRRNRDTVIIDTAGRLSIDEEMMAEAAAIRDRVQPHETLFVIDAMTGQDAVGVATAFLERVDYSGIILSKLDGDARGGAALSVAHVSGRPVKFASTGERLDEFEAFHPDRMASRILGMGDMLTLIEKAEDTFEEGEQAELQDKMRKGQFTLEEFLDQMKRLRKMGSMTNLLGMIPGMRKHVEELDLDEKDLAQVESIIHSMTPKERRDPKIINNTRRQRIARGCGRTVQDVNMLLRQFEEAKVMMRVVAGGGGMPSMPQMMGRGAMGAPTDGGAPHRPKPQRKKQAKTHGKNKKKKK